MACAVSIATEGKECAKCKRWLPESEFQRKTHPQRGPRKMCSDCAARHRGLEAPSALMEVKSGPEPDHIELAGLTRPKKRSECVDGIRPCPFVSCRHNLLINITPGAARANSVRETYPDLDNIEGPIESCSIDVADRGEHTLIEVSKLLGVNGKRVQQLEEKAIRKIRGEDQTGRRGRLSTEVKRLAEFSGSSDRPAGPKPKRKSVISGGRTRAEELNRIRDKEGL